ncbi:MAG: VWA domain-containing protein [Caldilineaceae bacterium]
MDLLWPGFLLLLVLVPLLIGIYIWMLRRRRRFAVRYSSLSLVRDAMAHQARWRRHVPFALFLLALTSLVFALTRPVSIISVPTDQTTIILAIDASGSMRATDIPPSRLEAAEAAAISFIQRQQSRTQIGLVAFARFAEIVQPPTTDQEALQTAIQSLTTGRGTGIGNGILKSIDAIAEIDKSVAPSVTDTSSGAEPTSVPKGAYAPDIVVLLTDGVNTGGVLPLDAAQQAADRGVRVYTIGYGTANGSIPFGGGGQGFGGGGRDQGGGGLFGGGGQGFGGQGFGGGGRFRTGIDETTLKRIADMTGGAYYPATSADELQNVFRNLPTYLITKHETTEISFIFAALGALLAAAAIVLSLRWHPLP